MKACNECKQIKPLTGFHKDWSLRDGHKSVCKGCLKLRREMSKPVKCAEDSAPWAMPEMSLGDSLACIRLRKWANDCANESASLRPGVEIEMGLMLWAA